MGDPIVRGPTIKAALTLAFGLTVGLWFFAGYEFTRRMAQVEREAAAINGRYTNAQQLLSTVRVKILVGSVYVRDALLDPRPEAMAVYHARVRETYDSIDSALRDYDPVVDSQAERERVDKLRYEIAAFRATMLGVLEDANSRRPEVARQLLQQRIVPKRELVIRVSEDVQALNRSSFLQQQASLADVYRVTQQQVWTQLGFALVVSLGIALVASRYSARLENQLRVGRERELETARDLRQLSAQLLTAQEEERRTIARELHDEVGQVLAAIKVELALSQTNTATNRDAGPALDDVRTVVDAALQRVRDLSHLLHPAMLDDLGLQTAIEWHLRGFRKRHDIEVDFRHEDIDERLDPATEVTAFRIVQEALTNVVKHARATSVQIELRQQDAALVLTITDNGVGFDANAPASGHRGLGLVGIRERVAKIDGTLRIETEPGRGTCLSVHLPRARRRDGVMAATPAAGVPLAPFAHGGQVADG
jgi:signal transduction histidine kinase